MPRLSTILGSGRVPLSAAWWEGLWQDVRHGCRVFAKSPGFTSIAVISIACGTGANVAMFSLADMLLLRPLPVVRPGELVVVGTRVKRGLGTMSVASYPDYVDFRDRTRSFGGLIASTSTVAAVTTQPAASPHMRLVTIASSNFFRVLGVEPALGRGFLPEEDRVAGRDAVVVLSHATWQQEFAADPMVLDRKIQIAGIEFTVVGVAPEDFTGLHPYVREAAFVPLAMWARVANVRDVDPLMARDFRNLTVRGRLNRGVTMNEAQAELTTLGDSLEAAYPLTNENQQPVLQTELEVRFERRPLDSWLMVVLTTLSVAVLCVACANVAGLLASRAPARAREIALRLAVGAGRGRVVRQLVTESFGIALAGGVAGLGVAHVGVVLLRQIHFPTEVISLPVLQLDRRALVFSLVVAMTSAFLFGLGPAIQTTRINLVSTLKASDVDTRTRYRLTGRNLLVALQVALSLVLLTVAVWSYNVFDSAFTHGPGFRIVRMAKVTIDPMQARYSESEAEQFFDVVLDRARRLPGAQSVAVTSAMPLFSFEAALIVPEGFQLPEGQLGVSTYTNSVDEGYFETMEIPILKGRAFQTSDTIDSRRVAIVNEQFARHYWPHRDALGARFRLARDPNGDVRDAGWIEIVGIARTSMYGYFAESPQDMVYFPFRQQPRGNMVLVVQTSGESASLVPPLREMVHGIDPAVPAYDAQTIEAFFDARVTSIATVTIRLIGGMGLMGMTLTMVGLYGLVAYAVSRRTREIGIRVAIGASYRRVVGMVLRQGMTPASFGLAIGLCLSAVTTRVLPMLIPLNQRYDSSTLVVVVPLVLATSLIASYVPARRAARVDPTVALRCE